MAQSVSYTQENLDAINDAIAKGVRSVKYTDKEIVYRSLDEMLKIRDLICKALGLVTGRGSRRVASTSKGLC